jgi:ribosome biogenesis GTPase A
LSRIKFQPTFTTNFCRKRGPKTLSFPLEKKINMPPKVQEKVQVRFGRVKNSLKMGIVGLPNVGKSSLFNLLTAQAVAAEKYS